MNAVTMLNIVTLAVVAFALHSPFGNIHQRPIFRREQWPFPFFPVDMVPLLLDVRDPQDAGAGWRRGTRGGVRGKASGWCLH
jgi:hypothetical protein